MGASYLAEGGQTQYPEIDRRGGMSLREFRRDYLYPGKPVVITGAIVLLRRNEARLQREADLAIPGPLEAPR